MSAHIQSAADENEHIMVCLSASASNPEVIRQAARISSSFHGKFTAFYVEMSGMDDMPVQERNNLQANIRMAEQCGANIIVSYGNDVAEQIAEYVKVAKVTQIIMGKTYKGRRWLFKRDSISDKLLKIAPNLKVMLIPDPLEEEHKVHWVRKRRNQDFYRNSLRLSIDILTIFLFLLLSTGICVLFEENEFQTDNLLMIYMMGGLLQALFARCRISSILYALGSVIVFNYFFTEPRLTLHVNDTSYITTFFVMFATSMTVSTLVQQMKRVAKQAAEKAYRTEILLETSQKLQQAEDVSQIALQSIQQLEKLLNCTVYCIPGKPSSDMKLQDYFASNKEANGLSRDEIAVASWAYKNNKHAGATTGTLPGARCLYLTVRNGDKIFAIIGIELNGKVPTAFEKSVMLALLNESALAFEKEELRRRERETALRLQQEQLRGNLLRAISHDLRTPLTSISGNADMLMKSYQMMADSERTRIFHDIYEDAVWLINLVENLLSVTRIENGTMDIVLQPEMVEDVLDASMKHLNRHVKNHKLKVSQADDMLMAKMDAKLIIQVLTNLVDNAFKHTPEGSEIEINVYEKRHKVVFEVADNGDGVPDDQKEKIFTMFYSGDHTTSDGRRCMGMGLTLCKSIIEAHGGRIWVEDNHPHGAVFRFEIEAEEVNF